MAHPLMSPYEAPDDEIGFFKHLMKDASTPTQIHKSDQPTRPSAQGDVRSASIRWRPVPTHSRPGNTMLDLGHDIPAGSPRSAVAGGVSTLPLQHSMAETTPRRVIGVCALDSKARSKSSRRILNRLTNDFDVVIFGDKVILDEDVANWPQCDYLISYYSNGFPLDKAIAYVREYQPFCVNDVALQQILFDRRLSLRLLDAIGIPTPRHMEINRDGGPQALIQCLIEYLGETSEISTALATAGAPSQPSKIELLADGDVLSVDGKLIKKPFVEKPVSGEDHNIVIYYPSSMGGGARKLFRKIGNRSSEYVEHLTVPRIITEPHRSFVVEEFLSADNAEDVKVFTVGSEYCLGETRKSPVVDGVVRRNTHGKEIRYITTLSREEKGTASRITKAFGQRICRFDIIRSNGKSYVVDVNGWAFVNDNDEYYEHCAAILRTMFLQVPNGPRRREALSWQPPRKQTDTHVDQPYSISTQEFPIDEQHRVDTPHPTEQAQKWKLKGVVSVIRNADHTPKQASTFIFDSRPFFELLQKDKTQNSHRSSCTIPSDAVFDAIRLARKESQENPPELEALEKLLTNKPWAEVQIKPIIDDIEAAMEIPVHSDHLATSSGSNTLSYHPTYTLSTRQVPFAKQHQRLQLIVKYGAVPTHATRYQSQELGRDMRNEISLLNKDILNHVQVRCSSTRCATATAEIWTTSFLDQKDVPEGIITTRGDLLDFVHTAKNRKEEIRTTLAQSHHNGQVLENLDSPLRQLERLILLTGRLKAVLDENWKRLGPTLRDTLNVQARWCYGEDASHFRDRWMDLSQQIDDEDKFDVMKVLQLYDYLRFDALHNRQFLEWMFTISPNSVPSLWPFTERALERPVSIAESIEKRDMEKAASQVFRRASNHASGIRPFAPGKTWSTPRDHLTGQANQSYLSELYHLSRDLSKYLRQRIYMSPAPEESNSSPPRCLPLLKEIANDIEELQASHTAQAVVYFSKRSTLYMLLNSILDSDIATTIDRDSIPELDFLSHISFELFEASNRDQGDSVSSSPYRIRVTISPGCHAADALEVRLDSKHCIDCSPRESLTPYVDCRTVIDSLRSRVNSLDSSGAADPGAQVKLAAEENKGSQAETGAYGNVSSRALSEMNGDDMTDGASDASSSSPSHGFWSEITKPTENSSMPSRSGLENSDAASSRTLTTFYNYTVPLPETPHDEGIDIRSVISLNDDIHSLAESTSAVEERRVAASYIVQKLTDDPELLVLYQDAIRKTNEARFIRNNRRLLKRYFLDLQTEGQTASQKLAISFLRSRIERTRISAQIFHLMAPSDGLAREKINIILGEKKDELLLLNRLLSDKDSEAHLSRTNEPVDMPVDFKGQQEEDVSDIYDYDYEDSDDESFEWNDDDVRGAKEENDLSDLESAAQFLTSSRAFTLYKDNFRNFLGPTTTDNQERHTAETSTSLGEGGPRLNPPDQAATGQTWSPKSRQRGVFGLYMAFVQWMTKQMRPVLKEGYRRIEWRCDCGDTLYADFADDDKAALEALAQSLQPNSSSAATPSNATEANTGGGGQQSVRDKVSGPAQQNQDPMEQNHVPRETAGRLQSPDRLTQDQKQDGSKFLALCVNTGGIYKTLVEIDTADTESDAVVFQKMKQAYKNTRGLRYRFRFIIKPVAVEFVQFTLWNLRSGYISVCDRPNCIPPETAKDYDYMPKPLRPPPPMPPEVFIHYLEHGEGELNPARNTWLPRLPKRRDKRVIDGDVACYGWGIHIIEGPNREAVFWIVMVTIVASVVAAVAWTALRDDIQGGAGLGALMMALPPVIMAAFLFRLGS